MWEDAVTKIIINNTIIIRDITFISKDRSLRLYVYLQLLNVSHERDKAC